MAIDLEIRNHVAVITINQPDKLNSLNSERLIALLERLAEVSADPDVRSIVLTGAGDRAFVAGADIKEMVGLTPETAPAFGRLGHAVASAIENAPQPVIAAVNGFALGGGCELALACDIRLAADTAVFAQPEVSLGIAPGWGGAQRLPRVVGPGLAAELIFTGRRVDAAEALRIGLVNAVYPAADLLPKALELAGAIAANSPNAVREAKRLIALTRGATAAADLAADEATFVATFGHPEQVEGMTAFIEKRAARFGNE